MAQRREETAADAGDDKEIECACKETQRAGRGGQ